jgi:hypothetical protein
MHGSLYAANLQAFPFNLSRLSFVAVHIWL